MRKFAALILLLGLLLSGCGGEGGGEESGFVGVYRLDASDGRGGAILKRQAVPLGAEDSPMELILRELNAKPERLGLERVFPEGVAALSCSVEKGVCTVEMSGAFALLDKMESLLCRSALTLSLSELDEVCSVDIVCSGRLLFQGLTVEDIRQADGLFESHERTGKIYLPAVDGSGLVPRSCSLSIDGSTGTETLLAEAVLEALPVYTERCRVLSAATAEGVCRLDLSEEFYGNEPGDAQQGKLVIYSLVNSLCRLNNVDSVIISVEGQNVAAYGGFRVMWPLSYNEDMIIY